MLDRVLDYPFQETKTYLAKERSTSTTLLKSSGTKRRSIWNMTWASRDRAGASHSYKVYTMCDAAKEATK